MELLQCQGCGGNHRLRYLLHRRENMRNFHNLEGVAIVENMVRETPRIYAALEELQEDHQPTVIKVEGKIAQKTISNLIDQGHTHSYITP